MTDTQSFAVFGAMLVIGTYLLTYGALHAFNALTWIY